MTLSREDAQVVATNPYLYAAKLLHIQDDNDQIVPLVYRPIQIDYLRNRTARDLILKPRQIGFSTAIQAEIFRHSTTRPTRSLTLADDRPNLEKLRRMQQKFYDYMPHSRKPARNIANSYLTTYPHFNSEVMIGTAGNVNIGRAGSYRIQHYSEVAHYKDAQSIMTSALQGGKPFWVVCESTPAGAQGWFYERCMEALNEPDESVWKLHFYTWFDYSEYRLPLKPGQTLEYENEEQALVAKHNLSPEQINWRRYKIKEMGYRGFVQEYPEDPITCFLTSGDGVFTIDASHLYDGLEYNPEHTYVAGLDWGQSNDYTAFSIFDATAYKEVVLTRARQRSWHSMRADIIDLCGKWHVEKMMPELNAAGSNIENLWASIEDAKLDTVIEAFNTTNRSKDMLVKYMQRGLTEDNLQLLDIDYATQELRAFQTKQTASGLWAYSHPPGGHDDTVIARMLANYACRQLF